MTSENDFKISKLTVRLKISGTQNVVGTGIIYYQKSFDDTVYIFTAAHCLFEDGDSFQNILSEIDVELYDSNLHSYKMIRIAIQQQLLYKDVNCDIGVLCIKKLEVEEIIGTIPQIQVVRERLNFHDFFIKGFPKATEGKELDTIYARWKQNMTEVSKFQLRLNDDYTDYYIGGFSGSGVFLQANDEIYLYGIFTRFRKEERGRVIYCQFVEILNQLLESNFYPTITFSYLGALGLTRFFFQEHIKKAISSLGDRYDAKLNFKLPIAQRFSDIAKDDYFKQRFNKIIDKWLTEKSWGKLEQNIHIGEIEFKLKELEDKVKKWTLNLNFMPDNEIDVGWIYNTIETLEENIRNKIQDLDTQREQEESKIINTKKDYSYKIPFENEIARLREINSRNYNFTRSLNNHINVQLVNNPFLIIKGEAGSGKSHLLGDISNDRILKNLPTIFLLGQGFHHTFSIEKNMLNQLDLNCTFTQLLNTLNSIGKQVGSRFLILIDAINESIGTGFWIKQLDGFISQFKQYPFIGLTITIRDSYFNNLIPQSVKDNSFVTIKTHQGFKGNEYEALKLFCDSYGLEQPKFPILAPEFINPLFLKLICKGVSNSSEKVFPSGFQGINKIFNYYIQSLNNIFLAKNDYRLRSSLVKDVVQKVALYLFKNSKRQFKIEEALEFFDNEYKMFPALLYDLIQEGIFIKNLRWNYHTEEGEEVLYFTYERFGDFYIGKELLKKYDSPNSIEISFQKGKDLGLLVNDYKNKGIIEALSVLLPEEYNLEIFEVFKWLFIEEDSMTDSENYHIGGESLNYILLDSFKWRATKSVDNEKITDWFNSQYFRVNADNYWFVLLESTTIENHPLNSDRLFRILSQYPLAKRDGFWQEHMKSFNGFDDENNAFPIRRLIDWAWTPTISCQTTFEVARLTGQTLAWILSSTHNVLRDEVTKAMVNILEQQPDALISILEKFKHIDDLYILERLYAVAYGCTLRTEKNISVQKIAQFTYDNIFRNENPPAHVLLRDYARNIIEYAVYKNLNLSVNIMLIRPPYRSKIPSFPSEQDIEKYHLDYENVEFKNNRMGRLYNRIHFSVMDWDFGRKIIEPHINYFSPISFVLDNEINTWKKKLSKKKREIVELYSSLIIQRETIPNKESSFKRMRDSTLFERLVKQIENSITNNLATIESTFEVKEKEFLQNIVIPHYLRKNEMQDSNIKLDSEPIKRWIVGRAFELGYDVEIHGDYDSCYTNFSDYGNTNVERIGKKYQWIAYYEMTAFLTDNYKIRGHWGKSTEKYEYYKGAWQMFLRDIDPVHVTKKNSGDDDEYEDEFLPSLPQKEWWAAPEYTYWSTSMPNSKWAKNLNDLPKPKDLIIRLDENGNEWICLEQHITWNQPKPFGKDRFLAFTKNIHYSILGYITHRKDKLSIVKKLNGKNLWNIGLPENHDSHGGMFNREKFWSPAYLSEEVEETWETIPSSTFKVVVATTNAKGNIEKDKSGTNQRYNIPCKTLFEGMKLQYASTDGEFKDSLGEIIVKSIDNEGVLIRKDKLFQYLDDNDLDIVWKISGEKVVKEGEEFGARDYYHFGCPCGIFFFNDNVFTGELNMFKRN